MSQSALAIFDFTLPADDFTSDDVIKGLSRIAKHWCFQLETSDTGYVHYQGRVSLIKRRRVGKAIKLFKEKDVFKKVHLSPSSTASGTSMCYVMKDDTRTSGPWKDTDPKVLYVPRHIAEVKTLRPFQADILKMATVYDTRKVDMIYCPNGNKGKSILIGKARALGLRCLPPVFDYKDILRMVYCMPTSLAYFVDMPRAMKQDKMAGFFAGLETIKDGYCYDDRYTFKEKTFDAPRIFVFTNKLPDQGHLSTDRWNLWTITNDYRLVEYSVVDDFERLTVVEDVPNVPSV